LPRIASIALVVAFVFFSFFRVLVRRRRS